MESRTESFNGSPSKLRTELNDKVKALEAELTRSVAPPSIAPAMAPPRARGPRVSRRSPHAAAEAANPYGRNHRWKAPPTNTMDGSSWSSHPCP